MHLDPMECSPNSLVSCLQNDSFSLISPGGMAAGWHRLYHEYGSLRVLQMTAYIELINYDRLWHMRVLIGSRPREKYQILLNDISSLQVMLSQSLSIYISICICLYAFVHHPSLFPIFINGRLRTTRSPRIIVISVEGRLIAWVAGSDRLSLWGCLLAYLSSTCPPLPPPVCLFMCLFVCIPLSFSLPFIFS